MLKGILLYLTRERMEAPAVKLLLRKLEKAEITYFFSPMPATLSATAFPTTIAVQTMPLSFSPEECLVLTDSASGISSAQAAGIPCLGYAPPEHSEDLFGAYALFEDFSSIDVAYLCRTHAHAMGYPADILSTERLFVREFSREDFPALYAMCTESSTAASMEEALSDYDTEKEKHTAYLRNVYPFFDLALWGVYEKSSGKLIGRAGFSLPEDDSDTFSLGYLIDVPYRKQGFAKELIPALLFYAKEQGYEKVSARIKKRNVASVKALTQCGFPYLCKEDSVTSTLTYLIRLTVSSPSLQTDK